MLDMRRKLCNTWLQERECFSATLFACDSPCEAAGDVQLTAAEEARFIAAAAPAVGPTLRNTLMVALENHRAILLQGNLRCERCPALNAVRCKSAVPQVRSCSASLVAACFTHHSTTNSEVSSSGCNPVISFAIYNDHLSLCSHHVEPEQIRSSFDQLVVRTDPHQDNTAQLDALRLVWALDVPAHVLNEGLAEGDERSRSARLVRAVVSAAADERVHVPAALLAITMWPEVRCDALRLEHVVQWWSLCVCVCARR